MTYKLCQLHAPIVKYCMSKFRKILSFQTAVLAKPSDQEILQTLQNPNPLRGIGEKSWPSENKTKIWSHIFIFRPERSQFKNLGYESKSGTLRYNLKIFLKKSFIKRLKQFFEQKFDTFSIDLVRLEKRNSESVLFFL